MKTTTFKFKKHGVKYRVHDLGHGVFILYNKSRGILFHLSFEQYKSIINNVNPFGMCVYTEKEFFR